MGGRRRPGRRFARGGHDRRKLELLGLDEELGPGGSAAPDEVTGSRRLRAAGAALGAVPGGRVRGVERERSGELEVALTHPDGSRLEVGLDRACA